MKISRPNRDEFSFLPEQIDGCSSLVVLVREHVPNIDEIITVKGGIVVVWRPSREGMAIQSNTFIGLD